MTLIENPPQLAGMPRRRLKKLGYANVTVRTGDGRSGWPEYAPFDGIIVTAAAPYIPQPLIDQLRSYQKLMLIEKQADGKIAVRSILAVRFVPLTGGGRQYLNGRSHNHVITY